MNRILKVSRFMLHEAVWPVAIFYIVIAALLLVGFSMPIILSDFNFQFDGMKMATTIFLLVAGLNSFKTDYVFLQANGVTRRHFYFGGLLAVVSIAVAMTAIDTALYSVLHLFGQENRELQVLLYPNGSWFGSLMWTLGLNLFSIAAGWFITMLYYRLGKGMKILVSVGVPVLFVSLPIVSKVSGGWIAAALDGLIKTLMGLPGTPNAYVGALSLACFAAVAFGFCFLLVRRAPVKEQDR